MTKFSVDPNERVAFGVLTEDADLAVINKPPGIVTQPGLGHERDSLLNGLFARWGNRLQALGKVRDYGLLHRLDRATSGIVLVAFRAPAYDALRAAFEARSIRKYYWAVVRGTPREPSGVIRKPIFESPSRDEGTPVRSRSSKESMKLARISSRGKPAVTAYRVLGVGRATSLIECRPVTGRLHQVRVHLASINCPILGDSLYASEAVKAAAPRLALHAHRLVFVHPSTGDVVDVRAAWPPDLRGLLKRTGLTAPREPAVAHSGSVEGLHEPKGDPIGDEETGVGEDPSAV